jgi:hypothetical protein
MRKSRLKRAIERADASVPIFKEALANHADYELRILCNKIRSIVTSCREENGGILVR